MTYEDIEETLGTDYSAVKDFLEQYGGDEHGQYIPGDSFYIKGLSDKPGLTFVEAKAEGRPPNENRDHRWCGGQFFRKKSVY